MRMKRSVRSAESNMVTRQQTKGKHNSALLETIERNTFARMILFDQTHHPREPAHETRQSRDPFLLLNCILWPPQRPRGRPVWITQWHRLIWIQALSQPLNEPLRTDSVALFWCAATLDKWKAKVPYQTDKTRNPFPSLDFSWCELIFSNLLLQKIWPSLLTPVRDALWSPESIERRRHAHTETCCRCRESWSVTTQQCMEALDFWFSVICWSRIF